MKKLVFLLSLFLLGSCTKMTDTSAPKTTLSPEETSKSNATEKSNVILNQLNDSFKTADFKLLEKVDQEKIRYKGYKIIKRADDNPSYPFVLVPKDDPRTEFTWKAENYNNKTLYFRKSSYLITEIRSYWQGFEFCKTSLSVLANYDTEDIVFDCLNDYGFESFMCNDSLWDSSCGGTNKYDSRLSVLFLNPPSHYYGITFSASESSSY